MVSGVGGKGFVFRDMVYMGDGMEGMDELLEERLIVVDERIGLVDLFWEFVVRRKDRVGGD